MTGARPPADLPAGPGFPTGPGLTARDPAFRDDPHPVYDRLRDERPVHHDADYGRFVITRYRHVRQILRHRDFGADARKASADSYMRRVAGTGVNEGSGDTAYTPPLVLSDDPDHRRLRLLLSKAFTPKAVEAMAAPVAEVTAELLDRMAGQSEIDFIAAYAGPLPTLIIAALMGIGRDHVNDLERWSEAILRGYDPDRDGATHRALRDAYVAASRLFRETVEARRRAPGDDLISAMVRARDEADRLSDLEIISLCTQLLVAGNVTTTDLMGNGLNALLDAPAELEKLKQRPTLIESAIEEILRFDCPITETARIAHTDGTLGGCAIKKGDTLTLSLAAANHDPTVFADPHRFDIERTDNPHPGFGSGIHVCLGAPLARLEARIGMGAFLARFPQVSRADHAARRRDLPFFRGFEVLPVRLR